MKALSGCLAVLLYCSNIALAQQTPGAAISPNLFGSITQGTAAATPISLSISDAIDRALRYNLGPIIAEQETRVSRAARLRALAELLPDVSAGVSESVQQVNLAAFGFSGFPNVPQVIGPFSIFDARARYAQRVLDFRYLHELRSEAERVAAGNFAQTDVRELVALITTDLYLQSVAAASRVEAARAELGTAQAVYDRATAMKESGVVAGIDVLRAQVQLQAQQQRVLSVENQLAREKLDLARAIGLPQAQNFNQTDGFITTAVPIPTLEDAFADALASRPDYKRALALVRAAEETRKAAVSRRLPSLQFNADYGDIGRAPAASHGTMNVQGTLLIPIYTGERTRAEIEEADSLLEERRAEAVNLHDRIEYEIRTADMDIQTAAAQVRVAQQARDLAQQQLVQAQDRFAAGVANGLEVTQAQEAVAGADENYISSLYGLNVAQASLARATGNAEQAIKSLFGGK